MLDLGRNIDFYTWADFEVDFGIEWFGNLDVVDYYTIREYMRKMDTTVLILYNGVRDGWMI